MVNTADASAPVEACSMQQPSRELSVASEFLIGGAAGLVDCLLFHWLDTCKVRRQDGRALLMDLQTGGPLRAVRPYPVIASLYAGLSTNVSLKLPYMAGMFAFHELNSWLLNTEASGTPSSKTEQPSALARFLSAALVGVEVSILLSPLEMIRIQGQNCGTGGLFSSLKAVAAKAPASSGFVAHALGTASVFSRGMTATMHREVKYCCGQFFLCKYIADALDNQSNVAHAGADSARGTGSGVDSKTVSATANGSLWSRIAGAMLGGIICTVVSHPDDVIKTRMQTHLAGSPSYLAYTTYTQTGLRILRDEGVHALYRGAAIRCLLRVPFGLTAIELSSSAMRGALLRRQSEVNCNAASI